LAVPASAILYGNFLELETIASNELVVPKKSASHIETWELYQDIDHPEIDTAFQSVEDKLELD